MQITVLNLMILGYDTRFQTNCLSHFILIHELDVILSENSTCIWTSSATGIRNAFDFSDIESREGKDPYGSSKWAVNLGKISHVTLFRNYSLF